MGSVTSTTRTVFIADDVGPLREALREVFERDGRLAVVGEASNGPDAVAGVIARQPDVLILDLSMPELDGLGVLLHVRDEAPRTKVVVLSGFRGDRVAEIAGELGAACYVEKGICPLELRRLVLDL